jgi:hypothetical protein
MAEYRRVGDPKVHLQNIHCNPIFPCGIGYQLISVVSQYI